jgi:hypothetical protein
VVGRAGGWDCAGGSGGGGWVVGGVQIDRRRYLADAPCYSRGCTCLLFSFHFPATLPSIQPPPPAHPPSRRPVTDSRRRVGGVQKLLLLLTAFVSRLSHLTDGWVCFPSPSLSLFHALLRTCFSFSFLFFCFLPLF